MSCNKNNNKLGGSDIVYSSRHVSRRGETRAAESRYATLNDRRGMNDKIDEVCEMMKTGRIDVLCLNETKKKWIGTSIHGHFFAYSWGVPESKRGCQGIGIVLSERMNECVVEYECVSPRIMGYKLTRLFIYLPYAPDNKITCQGLENGKFWDGVWDVLLVCKVNESIVMLGDLNSWVKHDGMDMSM